LSESHPALELASGPVDVQRYVVGRLQVALGLLRCLRSRPTAPWQRCREVSCCRFLGRMRPSQVDAVEHSIQGVVAKGRYLPIYGSEQYSLDSCLLARWCPIAKPGAERRDGARTSESSIVSRFNVFMLSFVPPICHIMGMSSAPCLEDGEKKLSLHIPKKAEVVMAAEMKTESTGPLHQGGGAEHPHSCSRFNLCLTSYWNASRPSRGRQLLVWDSTRPQPRLY
jgi:hypothetical protein